jgi:hypothetical protein
MPLYEEKLINPLAVRFSQDRIWPHFHDGTHIEDSLTQISTVPLQGGDYVLVLRTPFPPIEIIRLSQELREADGEIVTDETGQHCYGEESWFSFDNRRLYCLQLAALQHWPEVVSVVVKVLFDFPAVRSARHKFRTTSDGCSVKVSLPDGQQGSLWTWQEAAAKMQTAPDRSRSAMDLVRSDMEKVSKEMLETPPPEALLHPGARDTTVAERFNSGQGSGQNVKGQAAGMQLLGLLKGSAEGDDTNGNGLQALFAGMHSEPGGSSLTSADQWNSSWRSGRYAKENDQWDSWNAWDDSQGYYANQNYNNGNRNRRRRKPKGSGKGDSSAKEA